MEHKKAYFAGGCAHRLAYLLEHRIVVDIDFDERSELSIHKGQIAICAVVGTAVRNRNQLVVGTAADIWAEPAIKPPHKGRSLAYHQSSLASQQCLRL